MTSFDVEVQAELDKRKSEKQLTEGIVTPDTNPAVAETPAIEAAPVAPPAAPIVEPESTDFDTQVEAELQKRKLAAQQTPAEPAKPTEPAEPDYVTKFREYGPSKDDEDVKTTLELLSPEERNDLIKVHPWAYSKLNAKQQDEIFEESRKSKPITGADIASVAGSLLGSGVDLVKSAAEVLGDAGSAYALAPIKQAIKNKSWFEVKGENAIVQEAQDKLDTDARNLSGAVPSTIIRTTRMIQKMFGGKDLNSIANPIQRAIATLAPTDLQNVVGDPIPEQNAAQPNFWSIVPTNTGIIPFDIVTKIAQASTDKDAGGIAAVDKLNEMLGISDKDQSRTRDHIRRLYDAEVGAEDWKASNGQKKLSPWSQVAFSDVGQQAILFRERSLLPSVEFIAEHDGISLDQAQEKRNQIAEINAEKATNELTRKWNKDFDPSMEFLGSLFLGDAAFGEAGLALGAGKLAGPLLQKASTLGMTDREVSRYYDALQKLEKAKLIARQKDMSQPSWWGKSAEYVEKKQDEVTAAGQTLFENLPAPVKAAAPLAGKALAKVGLGGVGGGVGALLDPENPSVGMLEGLTLSTGLGVAPSVLRSVDRARRLIGAGEGKLFTEVAKAQESSLPARLIFNKATGPVIDYIAENSTALFKSGVNLGALSAVTSTLNSDDPEEFNHAVADGFGMGMGFHLAHGITGRIHGKDPAQDLNNRRKRDVEIFEAVKTASPATQGMLEQVSNYQTAVDRVDALVVRSESNLQQAAAKGNEKETKLAADALKNAMALQKEVLRANVQTRNEYGRSFLSTYADMNRLANGSRRAGQPIVSLEILSPEQIVDLHVSENSKLGMTPDEIAAVRTQGESYANERGYFDKAKNRAVINAQHVLNRTTLFGESPSDALRHEGSHALDQIPEFQKLNENTDKLLFTSEEKDLQGNVLKKTDGIYDEKALVDMYFNKYIGKKNQEEKIQFSKQLGLYNEATQQFNIPEIVKYMKSEVRAELSAGSLRSGLGKLMGAEATIANWVGMRQKQNLLARAIQSVTGLGGKPFSSSLLGIDFTPEVIAANKEAIKALADFNGRFDLNPEGTAGREMSEKEIRTNPVLRKRYGLSGGEFQTELKGVVRDASGKIVGTPVRIVNPTASEGNWTYDEAGNRKQTRGYGQVPDEFQGVEVPAGGSVEVYRDFVYEPDGKTPVATKPNDLANLETERGNSIRQALTDAVYDNSTTRLAPFSADGLSWSGIMSKSQIQAIKSIPESILPLSIKEKILAFNDTMARGDGSTFDLDYAPRLGTGKKYKGRKSDIYHIIPVGFGFSKAGNFYLRTLSLNAAFGKLKARARLMDGWLTPWGNDPNLFMKELQETYLNNTYEKRDGWLGLDPENPTEKTPLAEVKFGRFLDFMNMIGSDTPPNPQRASTPADPSARKRKSKLGAEEDNAGIDNLWRSHRLDAIVDIADTTEQTGRYRIDLDRVYKALMPAEETAPVQEERRPIENALGITATYSPESRPLGAQYVIPSGAELTASLVASGTSLESFGKDTLTQLAEFYGVEVPKGAKRGEIIDAINDRLIQAPVAAQPQETKFVFTTSTKRDDAIKKMIEAGDDQGIRDLNKTTILHVLSDLKHIPVTIEDTKGVYQGDKEVSSIIKVTTTNQQDLNRVRSRIADAAKMFQQMEFIEEKMGAGKRSLLGETDEDGFKHIGSSTLYIKGVTEDQIEAARKQAGINGLTLADGRIELYDRGDDPEFFNRLAALDTELRQAGGVVTQTETGVASVKSYSEDPQRYAGTIGYDDQSLHLYSASGEQERLKTPLIQKLMGLMGRPMEAPQGGRKSYFEAKDVTPEQVKKQVGIAQRFIKLPLNDLKNFLVQKAYKHLNTEIAKQYDYLTEGKDGTKFTSQPYDLSGEPYESSADAINDIRTKNSLKFLKTDPSSFGPEGEDFSYHPLLQDSGRVDANGVKLTYNDLFRAVHDAIAHGLFGAEFGPIGEESAWQTHMRTLDDPWARWALTTETRGQNSYVNYREQMLGQDGMPLKKGDEGYIPLKKRGFAEQKASLLPLEDSLTGDKKVDEVTRKLMKELGEKQSLGSAGGISFMPTDEKYPTSERGFYSGLQKTIDEKMPAKASPQQILSIVNNPQNAKADEVRWSNLAGFVEGKDSVTKSEVLDYLKNEGSVKFKEVTLEQPSEADIEDLLADEMGEGMDRQDAIDYLSKEEGRTEYDQYVLPNGENYREVVLTIPQGVDALNKFAKLQDQLIRKYEAQKPSDLKGKLSPEEDGEYTRLSDLALKEKDTRDIYTSSHFSQIPNYIAHMRLNERPDAEGRDGLFIEEIQSDRHQQGREKGYANLKNQEIAKQELDSLTQERDYLISKYSQYGNLIAARGKMTPEDRQREREISDKIQDALKMTAEGSASVPDAPFRKDWPVQMFKRALRDAIEGDKEWIGWTDGKTQNKRYPDRPEANQKGMAKFYNEILPNEIGKYVKKWGAKVEESDLEQSMSKEDMDMGEIDNATPEELAQLEAQGMVSGPTVKIWKIDITPEMRESIKQGGQIAFMPAEKTDSLEFKEWFGDYKEAKKKEYGVWGDPNVSKVIDSNGNPLVVYHGSDKSGFTIFGKPSKGFQKVKGAYYFAENKDTARSYAKGTSKEAKLDEVDPESGNYDYKAGLYPVYLDLKNPYEYNMEGANWDGTRYQQYQVVDGNGDIIFTPEGRQHLSKEEAEKLAEENSFEDAEVEESPDEWESTDTIVKRAMDEGYDGVIIRDVVDQGQAEVGSAYEPTTIYVAFDPTQIKSATQNVGTYSKTNPDIRFMPSAKLDETYAKAIESGDMEEAQRLVDERAREAFPKTLAIIPPTSSKQDISKQPLKIVYHGTGSDFTEFKSGLPTADDWGLFGNIPTERHAIFFAEEKDFANEYAKARDSERIIPAYLNAENPLVFDDSFDKYDELMEIKDPTDEQKEDRQTYKYIWNLRDKWEAFDGESGKEFVDWMRKKGFDSAILSETGHGLEGEPTQDVWAVLDPSQIKSADPATYDNEGKLIPLSQRFDTSKPDIRFMPYSPELPKTEDGKVDWEGFKTKTLEIGKPLADLSPLGGISFMPTKKPPVAQAGYDDTYLKKALKDGKDGKVKLTRPFRAKEALPAMEQLPVIGNQVDRNTFKYNQPAEVIFYEHDGTPVSFKWDGQMLVKPEFKDIAEEHAGKAVQLAMADRQTATGGDMGGVMHTFLKSLRTITIKDPLTGNDLIVVWANNEWKPAKSMKDKVRMFGAKDLLAYLMGEDAHASNARSVRRISNEIDNSGMNDKEIDTFLILANKGVKTARIAEQNKTITDSLAAIEKATKALKKEKSPEKIDKLKKDIKVSQRSISDAEAKLPQYEITPEETGFSKIIKNFRHSFTAFNRGTQSEANFKAKEKEFYDFLKTPTFTKLRKAIHGKHMIKLDDTFKGRKAAVQNLLGLTIKGFNIDHILPMTADFKGGRIHHIVSSVELSTNTELGAVYLGEDPEQAKFMTPLEAAAAAQIKADPNFVVHEAYAWGMLGPVEGNHFLNTNPQTPEEYFPAFRKRYAATKEDAEKADKITNASESNLVNTMRDQKSFALILSNKSKK